MTEIKRPAVDQPSRRGNTAPAQQATKGAATALSTAAKAVGADERESQNEASKRGPVRASQPLAQALAAPGRGGMSASVGLGRTNPQITKHTDLSDMKNISELVQTVKQEPRTKGLFGMMSRSKTPHSSEREALKSYQSKLNALPVEQRERQLVRASLADIKDALK